MWQLLPLIEAVNYLTFYILGYFFLELSAREIFEHHFDLGAFRGATPQKARSSDNKKLNETFLKLEGGPIRQQLNMLTPPSRLIFICYFGTSLENTGIFNFQVIATNVLMGIWDTVNGGLGLIMCSQCLG